VNGLKAQHEARLDPGNRVRNIPTHDPVIEIKRKGIFGDPKESMDRIKWQ
jgi:hypothetical protein